MDRFKEPEEPKVWGVCDHCDQDIHEGDGEVSRLEGGVTLHDDCFLPYAENVLGRERIEATDQYK
jgi:hypothetical protein